VSSRVLNLNDGAHPVLENVNLVESQRVQTGLREKRRLELGGGGGGPHGGGWDDDEFEELGGTQAPSRGTRGSNLAPFDEMESSKRGFQIGKADQLADKVKTSDIFVAPGQAISLASSESILATASDFMTKEEEDALLSQAKREKKATKFKKDKKKKDKKRSKRRLAADSDDDDEKPVVNDAKAQKSLLEELEETAVSLPSVSRKRRRDEEPETDDGQPPVNGENERVDTNNRIDSKRSKYDEVMAKGNQRSQLVFGDTSKPQRAGAIDEEPDDAFLNAALAKARRLNQLKEMSQRKKSSSDSVVAAIQQANAEAAATATTSSGTITFAVDETREFTRALLARTEQADRDAARKNAVKKETAISSLKIEEAESSSKLSAPSNVAVKKEETGDEADDIRELAMQVDDESNDVADSSIGQPVTIGRGVGGIIQLLKQTGEITRKNAGKEEMRGRAKDKRTYEDYEPLELSKVVKIDESRAHSKDKEMASREVKLEYRDKYGRLLTRKEAFRDLSYQFHGYGSGKRKEEKKLEQIAREQAEARLASRQSAEGAAAGTFGALKATQKASGKAFIVHKTGT
jgi:U4/U6.U5 tri-snRNP-associated protein 1